MNFNLIAIVPELYLLLVIAVLFVFSLGSRDWEPPVEKWLPFAAGLGTLVTIISFWSPHGLMFYGVYKVDFMSLFFKGAIAFGFFVTVLNATRNQTLDDDKRPDYYLLMALSAFGLMIIASSVELITIYLAMELSSYCVYAMIPLRAHDKGAAEAGIKYILFGAVATAIALFGFSYVLAGAHTSYISELAKVDWNFATNPMAVAGLTMFMGGMFFKLALFPFHFWCPDLYQGASNETTAYAATLPKLGAIVVLIRLAALFEPGMEIMTIMAVLGGISMTYGNFAALAQTDIKRLLGFSSVAHAGYIMVGLVAGTAAGISAAAFYALTYILMNLLCFWVVSRIAVDGRNLRLKDLNGLHKRSPGLAFSLAIGAFALVGLPPTMGFMGKFFLITAAWNNGYNWLVILLAANSAIAIYYYLNMVRHAYTNDAEEELPLPDNSPFSVAGAGMLAAVVFILGVIPGPVFNVAIQAGKAMMP
ncbi:NADH-quinone oxidoreductase subunit N [Paucidesulfovibrio gracilis DSM 16080]|uniref:NADH-quinone oxidoreductase subunit N n=1 Tax=Paucidesulfovibrio gracilis DSM 16080 TaxID=1121449 RepID=A0A1T4X6N3_9BACT|nr:NADH-quinone oxidoreductase subunit N [Paucidesulfovibrio gracilis]SKA84531.1 NADH-quinone oxidoreductase subunit N [Paucidesulfovibrio gracilis DSM 16080]